MPAQYPLLDFLLSLLVVDDEFDVFEFDWAQATLTIAMLTTIASNAMTLRIRLPPSCQPC